VRLIVGLTRLEQLKRDALPLPVEYRDAMPQWIRANKGARDVRLCVSDETDVPVAVGLFDAMILVPHSLLDRLSQGEVDQICLHELAHLRRADDWTNGLQRVIIALLGWNPAAQFIGQQLDLEREVACDDWVLSFVGRVRPYALCLTKMAESAAWPRHPIPAPGVFATRKHISVRIERLLGAGRNIATNLAIAPAAAAVAAVGALALLITVVAPSVAAPYIAANAPAVAAKAPNVATSLPPAPAKTRTVVREVRVPVFVDRPVQSHPSNTSAPPHPSPQPHPHPQPHPYPQPHPNPQPHPFPPPYSLSVPGMHVAVPHIDAKRMAQSISASVNESIAAEMRGETGNSHAYGPSHVAQNAQNCSGCDFAGADWSGRDLHGINYLGANLTRAKLVGTNFTGSNFNGVDFSKADLRNASFRGAHLVGCDFSGADLTGVDFRGARISGSQFTGAQLAATELRDVLNSCSGCDFSHANLRGVNLSNVRASGDDFTGADLRDANFAGANLTGVDFSRARLDGANLAGTTLNGCDLGGVDLTHVDLSRTKMVGMDFERGKPPE
jgi:uncharacterized protein YjbI with pentapeptide repeats